MDKLNFAWKELLLLLEEQTLHLPSPKNHCASNIIISSDVSIFATDKSRTVFCGSGHSTDSIEDDMMAARWIAFEFFHQIPVEKQKEVRFNREKPSKLMRFNQV